MINAGINFISPNDYVFGVESPFAALIDTNDKEWKNISWVHDRIGNLLNSGCRYVVCIGARSEFIHDEFDNFIIDNKLDDNIVTTFHDQESLDEVINFFVHVAMCETKCALIISSDKLKWRELLDKS